MLTLVVALLAAPPSTSVDPVATEAEAVVVLDDGAARAVARQTARRGRDDAPAAVVYADPPTGRAATATIASTAIVRVARGVDVNDLAARHGLRIKRSLMPTLGMWLVASTRIDEDGLDVAVRLQRAGDADIDAAFPNFAFRHTLYDVAPATFVPNDPRYPAQFFHRELRLEEAWAISLGDASVNVTVVDNGCDLEHADLVTKLDVGHDVVADDDDPSFTANTPSNEHGTACAGLIAAETDNDLDVAGACPRCRLQCTRLLPSRSEPVPLDADVRAFGHALEDDVAIVSNSWGFVDAIPVPAVLRDAIIEVQQNGRGGKGAVVVFASGNDSREIADDELLAVAGVLGVGATNNLGELTQFSNSGRSVDVTAPTGTVSTDVSGPDGAADGDVTVTFGGTSSACPLVAGVAGLILSVNPALTADEVNAILESTAEQAAFARPDEAGHDLEYGFGLVRADRAVARAAGLDGAPPPGTPDPVTGDCQGCGGESGAAVLLAPLWSMARRRRQRR